MHGPHIVQPVTEIHPLEAAQKGRQRLLPGLFRAGQQHGDHPPRGIVLLGPQREVQSFNPKVGVHTRLTDEVEEWKIKRSLELVREMGLSAIIVTRGVAVVRLLADRLMVMKSGRMP